MSVFVDMLVEMLPMASSLQNKDNEFRKVLDYTIGAYMEDKEPVFDELFLSSATGGWLDAFGRDYGVSRRVDEDDDSYRNRIIFEKLEYLTVDNLKNIFGVELFNAYDGFNPTENDLTSDNPYISSFYLGITDKTTQQILDKKFIIDNNLLWYTGGELDYIINISNQRVLQEYIGIYYNTDVSEYFSGVSTLKSVKLDLLNVKRCENLFTSCTGLIDVDLNLPKATKCFGLFWYCSNLTSVNLNLPNAEDCDYLLRTCSSLTSVELELPEATDCEGLLAYCTALTSVTLNLPKLNNFMDIFDGCTALQSITVTIPDAKVTSFKSYVLGLELEDLTSFIVNGEEVDLS